MSVITLGWIALVDGTIQLAHRELTEVLQLLSEPPPLTENSYPRRNYK
jgi:hypothetical protein